MTNIPEGHGIIAGRGYENAVAALAAAEAAGVSPSEVLAVDEGYLVPDAVLAAFHEAKGGAPEPQEEGEEGVDSAEGSAAAPEDIPKLDGYYSPGPEEGSAALPESFEPELEPQHGENDVPDDSWKNAEIKEWADAHDVDLGGATKKADMLAAISSADTEEE
jgi:hypothetical protein